jgi:hypothetical protein
MLLLEVQVPFFYGVPGFQHILLEKTFKQVENLGE